MNKKCSYLSERVYATKNNLNETDIDRRLNKILPAKVLDYLCENHSDLLGLICSDAEYKEHSPIYIDLLKIYQQGMFCKCNINESVLHPVNFKEFYIPFLKLATYWLIHCFPEAENWSESLFNNYLNIILICLDKNCIRVLIVELHYADNNQMLKETEPDMKYNEFVKEYLADPRNIEKLFQTYPVLERIILECIEAFTANYIKIYKNFLADLPSVKEKLPVSEARKIKVIKKMGDTHIDSSFTAGIFWEEQEGIMYKPRSSKIDLVFHELVSSYYEAFGLEVYAPVIIEKGDYSWYEYIMYRECNSVDEVERYYLRLGINLFVSHLLGITDLHFENIIVCGEYPVFIDLEVINGLIDGADKKETSVSDIGILPMKLLNKKGEGINVGVLNEIPQQKIPFKVPHVINPYSSEIRVVYKYASMATDKSIVRMNGKTVGMEKYATFITAGFEKAYAYYLAEQEKLAKQYCYKLLDTVCRYLIRNTQVYDQLLNSSYWPGLLMDGAYRNLFLYSIMNMELSNEQKEELCNSEIECLLKGIIPYFSVNTSSRDLYMPDRIIAGFLKDTPAELWRQRFMGMCIPDMEAQKKVIQRSLFAHSVEKTDSYLSQYTERIPLEKEQYTEVLHIIASDMLKICEENDLSEDRYLYDGLAGRLLFFHAVNSLTDGAYEAVCNKLGQNIQAYTECVFQDMKQLQSERTGVFNGESSIVYLYQLLYTITGDDKYLNLSAKHIEIVRRLLAGDAHHDVMAGNAGAVLAFISQYKLTSEKTYLDDAECATGYLTANSRVCETGIGWTVNDMEPLAGFSHGNSGIMLALTRLYAVTGKRKYLEPLREALAYENSLYDPDIRNWTDLRSRSVKKDSVSWCHGAPGILLARNEMAELDDGEIAETASGDIKAAVQKILDTSLKKDMCLCHGNLGNIMILRKAEQKKYCDNYLSRVIYSMYKKELVFPEYEKNNAGLMTGMAGIGYTIVRIASDYQLPDILNASFKR